ncbi:MAG: beta-lactamase family protein [Desulfobacterales bacterium]|uniref:Beta-lactamase family protein n=1 Tax=Candidatus Desulfatibia vada TaxID=2841696 RepID=A0A8J6TU98_9BACT|nr:beta-lactamase family protein [Candidatus Desulfatibia vada]
MKQVDQMMKEAITDEVFPGGVLLVAGLDSVVFFEAYGYADIFSKRPMTNETVFDLASLTKPLATTLAVMQLVSQHKLRLEQNLGSVLPLLYNSEKSRITLKQLLCHTSGICDYRPYYESLDKLPPERRRDALREFLVSEPLINPPGAKVLYSDLGFMLLNWVVEQVSERRLDQFVDAEIYAQLGIENLFFVNLDSEPRNVQFAATERCPWRDTLINGVVHDENAYAVGGIEGHAGLFGTAKDVYRLLFVLLTDFYGKSESILFEKKLMQTFLIRDGSSGRPLGFDAPLSTGSSCGQYFSKKSVGHLGFTGTSFWMDLDRGVIVILLTNRVHPSRDNVKIKDFRPQLHDVVMTLIES